MIEGILVNQLKTFSDEKGKVMHMMRSDSDFFERFGEIYFSVTNPGFVKGWKKHLRITQHFAVPAGNIKLVLYDDRDNSRTNGEIQELIIGTDNYNLIRIPPKLWYSFSALGDVPAMIANCINMPYDPDEIVIADLSDKRFPYTWAQT